MTPSYISTSNASAVTVTTSPTPILDIDPITVKAGDLFDIQLQVWGEKVTSEGDVMIAITHMGTAAVENITGWPYGGLIFRRKQ